MASRLELHKLFTTLVDNVYYQPPESVKMKYPCIRYSRNGIDNEYADDLVYKQAISYEVTVIGYDPDSPIVFAISKMPTASDYRHYTKDGLNHDTFTIYY